MAWISAYFIYSPPPAAVFSPSFLLLFFFFLPLCFIFSFHFIFSFFLIFLSFFLSFFSSCPPPSPPLFLLFSTLFLYFFFHFSCFSCEAEPCLAEPRPIKVCYPLTFHFSTMRHRGAPALSLPQICRSPLLLNFPCVFSFSPALSRRFHGCAALEGSALRESL